MIVICLATPNTVEANCYWCWWIFYTCVIYVTFLVLLFVAWVRILFRPRWCTLMASIKVVLLKQLAHCPNKRQHSPTNANILKLAVVGSSWYLSLECPVNQLPAPHCSDFFQLATYFFNCVLNYFKMDEVDT